MDKYKRLAALISILPFSFEKKFSYLYSLVPTLDKERLLEYKITKILEDIDKELKLSDKSKESKNTEKAKINEIRSKLASLIK